MGSAPGMESSLSGRLNADGVLQDWRRAGLQARRSSAALVSIVALTMGASSVSAGQTVTPPERAALVQAQTSRGGRAEDVDALIRVADEAAAKGLPSAPVVNKIREGIAKGVPPARINPVVQQMVEHLQTADGIVREGPTPAAAAERAAAVTLLAEALGAGVTPAEVRDLRRQAQPAGVAPLSADAVASAARGLGFIKDARLPVTDGSAVIAEASRRGFRGSDLLDLGREVKRRERDYQAGTVTLRGLRDQIARGDRLERLFPDRPANVDRPAGRPDVPAGAATDRPVRPETTQRPGTPERPATPERPQPDRPQGR